MAETVIPTIMDIARANGYTGDTDPETVIEALEVLGYVIGSTAGVITYRGTVATYSDLPTTGIEVGDMYNVQTSDPTHGINAGDYVVWNGTSWDVQTSTIDISGFFDTLSNADIDAMF